ncbi:MAG: transglycosylase SLT domain-containing protein, partial [Bacteroidia bacterium]|nr:transglycosylase SLT domain-containing protein [Bacteroidia bacterium]
MKTLTRILLAVIVWSACGLTLNETYNQSVISDAGFSQEIIRDFDQNTISERLGYVEGVIDLEYSYDAKKLIKRYMLQGRHETKKLIENSFYYFPMFDYYFDKYNVPKELKYITLLESSLKYRLTSAAGARGLWQLMPATARWMGLQVNNHKDQRINPD